MTSWKCPNCGARANQHGNGGATTCAERSWVACCGFLCECDSRTAGTKDHGTDADPCQAANCYHCQWGGTFPVPRFDPKKLRGWARKAYDAGWIPPKGWVP